MKRILVIIALLYSITSFAQIPLAGYPTGIGVGFLYPLAIDTFSFGGWHSYVDTNVRNNMSVQRKKDGTAAWTRAEKKLWIWNAATSKWDEFAGGGSGGGAVNSVNGQTGTVTLTTDNIPEGLVKKYFLKDGNSWGSAASIGTLDTFDVKIIRNGVTRMWFNANNTIIDATGVNTVIFGDTAQIANRLEIVRAAGFAVGLIRWRNTTTGSIEGATNMGLEATTTMDFNVTSVSSTSKYIRFRVRSDEAGRFNNVGQFLLGTATDLHSAYKVQLKGGQYIRDSSSRDTLASVFVNQVGLGGLMELRRSLVPVFKVDSADKVIINSSGAIPGTTTNDKLQVRNGRIVVSQSSQSSSFGFMAVLEGAAQKYNLYVGTGGDIFQDFTGSGTIRNTSSNDGIAITAGRSLTLGSNNGATLGSVRAVIGSTEVFRANQNSLFLVGISSQFNGVYKFQLNGGQYIKDSSLRDTLASVFVDQRGVGGLMDLRKSGVPQFRVDSAGRTYIGLSFSNATTNDKLLVNGRLHINQDVEGITTGGLTISYLGQERISLYRFGGSVHYLDFVSGDGGVRSTSPSGILTLYGTRNVDLRANNPVSTGGIRFLIGSTEHGRVSASGNVLFGTTTDNATDKMQVNGSLIAGKLKSTSPATGTSSDKMVVYNTSDFEFKIVDNLRSGSFTGSGDGTTAITVTLPITPTFVMVTAGNANAIGVFYTTPTTNGVIITYTSGAPATGTSNLAYNIIYR